MSVIVSKNGYMEITDNAILRMLKNHNSFRKNIDVARKQALRDITDIEDMIATTICPARNTDNVGGGRTNKIQDPTADSALRLHSARYREKIQHKQQELLSLDKEEEAFDRVCSAFKKSCWLLPREFEIVNELFYSNKKTTTWENVAQELNISKGKITEARQLVCKLIRYIYDSAYKTEDIDRLTESELYSLVEEHQDRHLLRHID